MGSASRFAAGNITSLCLAFVELFRYSDVPISSFPASATTLHFEFYAEGKGEGESKKSASQSTRWVGFQSGFRRDRIVIETISLPQCDRDPRGRLRQNGENSSSHHGRAARATSGREMGKDRETRPTAHLLRGTQMCYSNFVSKVPEGKQMLLFTYVRLAHGFSDYKTRLKSVQVVITV